MTWTHPDATLFETNDVLTQGNIGTYLLDNLLAISHPYDYATSDNDVVSTAAETSLWSKTITGGHLGTNGLLYARLVGDYLHNNAAGDTLTLRVKFGGGTLFNDAYGFNSSVGSARQPWVLTLGLGNRGATNSQLLWGTWLTPFANATAPTTGIGDIGGSVSYAFGVLSATAAVDTTADQTFEVTAQWSASHANNSFRRRLAVLNLARN